jgi:cardiolipin synthase
MPDLTTSNILARALHSVAVTLAAVWRSIPGEAWAALYLAWVLGSVVFVILQRRRPTATLAWILAFITLPLLGAVVYFFFGPRKLRRRKIRRELAKRFASRIAPAQQVEMPATLASRYWLGSLARIATAYGDAPPKQARSVTIFTEGDATYEAIEAAMRQARRHIHLEYYIFEPDAVGTRWRDLLTEKAREGVAVRLLVDALGSKNCKARFWRPLLDAGGEVRQFNPPRLFKLRASLLNFRTHRKIVIVDARLAFTGGINVNDGYSGASGSSGGSSASAGAAGDSATKAWRDTHLAIEGPAALDLQMIFLEDWFYAGASNARHKKMDRQMMDNPGDIGLWFLPLPAPDAPPDSSAKAPAEGPWVQIIASGPDEAIPAIHRFFFTAITSARRRIWLTTPYFVPDEPMMTSLATARARGVDVRILLPRLGDSKFVAAAASTFAEEIMREGVPVWEYTPRMIHAKTIVIDDELTIIGTANIDNRSFRLNFEVAVAIYDAGINAQQSRVFEHDLTAAEQLEPDDGRQSFAERLLKSTARLAAPLL